MYSFKHIISLSLFATALPTIVMAEKPKAEDAQIFNTSLISKAYQSKNTVYDNGMTADTSKAKKDSTQPASPRDGKYLILSYGSNPANPMKLGYFILSANTYKYYDLENKLLGDGTYVYDVTDKQVKWQSGPFKAIGWGGDFSVEANGKTHIIHLKNNTTGTNSIE